MGRLRVEQMNMRFATEILNWKYDTPYDFYNNEMSIEGLKELLENKYFVCVNQFDQLIGFFCIGQAAQVPKGHDFQVYKEDYVDIGLGMRPDLTGKGNGQEYFRFILENIQKMTNNQSVRLTVATFNERAIRLYEKSGFVVENEFHTERAAFITMVKLNGLFRENC